jgi:peroxiredoxin
MRFFLLTAAAALTLSAANENAGRRAPGFSLSDPAMQQHDIYDLRGKVVLLEIMQTRCPHCKELAGVLEKLKGKYGASIQILSIVLPPDTLADVKEYIQTMKVTTPILFDCGQVTASYLKITPQNPKVSFPHLFVIDKEGIIRHDLDGGVPADLEKMTVPAISTELDQVLKATPVPAKAGKK